ncbi:hypothetical protein EES45_36100 [Streptomyces sp. ADI97-07]|uniref:hypothetical protein n=1 Tax=Streptomyces sp. ADI97-07 TaxID=1522762 RepID=UPI000F55713F|nr:hypothetical protein [Streptomyces sp. ADI97-07]RPK70063.1 hypothetical protein EES45_36100 [Streptomyces sp. ADI97-07]
MRLRRRLASLLFVLVAVLGLSVSAGQSATADGIVDGGIEATCRIGAGPLLGAMDLGAELISGSSLCDKIGDVGAEKVDEAWKAVKDSVLGDVIKSAEDVTKWVIKKTLTVSLLGPSVDLRATGLWGGDATLAGMMTWLGLVIAAFGVMWQLGKMAVTGQAKHAGRAMTGWIENIFLSTLGVSMFALLLVLGDALSTGVVNATFDTDAKAFDRIIGVLLPSGVANPITLLVVVLVLLIIGGIQLIMIFLRQSAIPIICILLPVAGGGRAGGDTTRKWAPTLITSGLVIIAYKPTVAIIICIGFAEFGESKTLVEWLRGCATLLLAVLAPGPLTKIFAPFGAAAGAGMSAGGATGALAGAAGYFAGKTGGDGGGGDGGGDGDGGGPATPVQHAEMVNQTMGKQGGGGGGESGEEGGEGGDAQAQASRNQAGANVPAQGGAPGAEGAVGGLTEGAGAAGGSSGAAAGAGGAAAVALPAAAAIQVLDGVNDGVQSASGAVGGGEQS